MNRKEAVEEYAKAYKEGHKEYKECIQKEIAPNPAVLEELLDETAETSCVEMGLVYIPTKRIVGTMNAGRISAFTPTFRPLMEPESEFAAKWISLCADHLGDTGIQSPIECVEYLGNFYVQEGNKRVSVLRHFGAVRIPGYVKRVLPIRTENPRIQAYYEFLDFYAEAKLYVPQFYRPGDYKKLLQHMGKKMGDPWTEAERKTFRAYYYYFSDAFGSIGKTSEVLPEDALLLWLELYPYENLGSFSAQELKNSIAALWEDMVTNTNGDSVKFQTKAEDDGKGRFVSRVVSSLEQLNVAFVHQLTPNNSTWISDHERGKRHIEEIFGDKIIVRSYYGASTSDQAESLIAQAVAEGAQVVFTTTPTLRKETLKVAVKNPKVRFLNCSVDQPYSSIRSYYGRFYEAQFITGAIAGAMARNDRIGYIASYPVFGEPAAINAFALGAQMTNPRAQIELKWACVKGLPRAELFADGIRIVSTQNAPSEGNAYCNNGTYLLDDSGELIPLGTPIWGWGEFYEYAIQAILSGGMQKEKGGAMALNYWFGLDSGVIGLDISEKLPQGVRQMANLLYVAVKRGYIDPFGRTITAQDGSIKSDGTVLFSPEQILRMDWLCENVVGHIPAFDEILPECHKVVQEMGIYRDRIPALDDKANADRCHLL